MGSLQAIANADVSAGLSKHNVQDDFKHLDVDQRREICDLDVLPYEVAILNVTGELNVGNIIRTASLCGARKIHILGRRKYDSRGTVGAENYIDVRRLSFMTDDLAAIDIQAVEDYFDIKNLYPIFVEQQLPRFDGIYPARHDGIAVADNFARNSGKLPCYVFGNEGRGIPEQLMRNMMNRCMIMPLKQRGVIRSFNVGSAAAIVLYKVMEYYEV